MQHSNNYYKTQLTALVNQGLGHSMQILPVTRPQRGEGKPAELFHQGS